MSNKKLGLLLLPLLPLSAIGIVEIANRVIVPETAKPVVVEVPAIAPAPKPTPPAPTPVSPPETTIKA